MARQFVAERRAGGDINPLYLLYVQVSMGGGGGATVVKPVYHSRQRGARIAIRFTAIAYQGKRGEEISVPGIILRLPQ